MFTKEDDEEYEKLLKEAEEKIAVKALNINGQEIAVEEMENLNDEVWNFYYFLYYIIS